MRATDVAAFLNAYRAVDWRTQPANTLVTAIRLALQDGIHVAARELSKLGMQYYPDNPDVQRLASIFFSNKPAHRSQPDPNAAANVRWIGAHGSEYSGQWVALRNGVLLGAAESLPQLIKITGDVRGTDILVTIVY